MTELLRQHIASGEIQPGTRLRQNDVARELGVSTTPVREAFAALRREGLLTSDSRRGVVVFEPTVADVVEQYEIRTRLEALAIRNAIPNLTDAILNELEQMFETMGAATSTEYVELNRRFHHRLYECSGMPHLVALTDDLRDASGGYLSLLATRQEDSTASAQVHHRAILDACQARDVEQACAAVEEHLRTNMTSIVELLTAR